MTSRETVPIESSILVLRGQRVILAADLAKIYGVETRALNQAVKRNQERFPEDFTFRLTREETMALPHSRSQSVILKRGANTKYRMSSRSTGHYGGQCAQQPARRAHERIRGPSGHHASSYRGIS